MDLAVLLQSKGDDSPSGENLEYDPTFTAMQLAAQPGEERQIGDEITAAADPDYGEVLRTAQTILERSHDLRAAVFLADAILQSDGLQGFADVTRYIRACLEDFWDSCHPQLDEDDGDPTMRINAVQELCGKPGEMAGPSPAYRSLRRTPLTYSRSFGRLTLREIAGFQCGQHLFELGIGLFKGEIRRQFHSHGQFLPDRHVRDNGQSL